MTSTINPRAVSNAVDIICDYYYNQYKYDAYWSDIVYRLEFTPDDIGVGEYQELVRALKQLQGLLDAVNNHVEYVIISNYSSNSRPALDRDYLLKVAKLAGITMRIDK